MDEQNNIEIRKTPIDADDSWRLAFCLDAGLYFIVVISSFETILHVS